FAIAAQQHSISLTTALLNAMAALIAVLAVNNLIPGRRYPQCIPVRQPVVRKPKHSINHGDLQYAVEKLDTYLDISEDDLVSIYDLATAHAHRRHERRTCVEVMTSPAISVDFATGLNEAWALMQQHHLHGVPVVDRAQRVIGVLTLENFLRHVDANEGLRIGDNIRRLLRPTPTSHSNKPEVVGQIMSMSFATANTTTSLGEVAGMLSADTHPVVVPIVDAEKRLAGVITQTDLLAAIYHRQAAAAARKTT
ncbi:MAG: CBS domain-containing protein, partial [Betaproteobacteria bacterium]|nr:CBS domain-containing protein [Betaproteobacteria bacterium]